MAPGKLEKILKKALRESRAGNIASARAYYEKAIKLNPSHPEANFFLGEQFANCQDYRKALQHLQLAVDFAPGLPKVHNAIGNVYLAMGEADKALSRYQRALRLDSDYSETHYCLGRAYRQMGRLTDAAAHLRRALELNPQLGKAHDELAHLLEGLGNTGEAIDHYKLAVELDPANLTARHHLDALTGLTPDSPPESYLLSIFDAHADKFDRHLVGNLQYKIPEMLRRAIEKLPEHPPTFRNALDLGCGTGLCGAAFRDIVKSITGIDIAPRMIAEAKRKQAYDRLLVGDIVSCLDNLKERYDLFIAADVFIYIGKLSSLFEIVEKRADSGAYFIFSVEISPDKDYLLLPSGRYAHSPRYIEALAAAHHFNIVSVESAPLRKEREAWIVGNIYVLKFAE